MPCGEHGVSYFVQMYSHLSFINNIRAGNFNTEKYWFRIVCKMEKSHLWDLKSADFRSEKKTSLVPLCHGDVRTTASNALSWISCTSNIFLYSYTSVNPFM